MISSLSQKLLVTPIQILHLFTFGCFRRHDVTCVPRYQNIPHLLSMHHCLIWIADHETVEILPLWFTASSMDATTLKRRGVPSLGRSRCPRILPCGMPGWRRSATWARNGRKHGLTRGSGSDDRVCSNHFLDMDFTVPRELATQLGYRRHSLKPDAVPSQQMRGPDDYPPSPKWWQTAAVKLKFAWVWSCLLNLPPYLPPVLFLFYSWGETSTKNLNAMDHMF